MFAKWVPEHEISACFRARAAFLFWSGLCASFPTTCHWFVTPQQVSSGQTSRGKFCVSKQLHKPATFLHTNEGFPYANRGAGSYLISCKDLVFRLNRSSAACSAHKILNICSEQVPLCSWGETTECCTSVSPYSCVLSHYPNRSLQELLQACKAVCGLVRCRDHHIPAIIRVTGGMDIFVFLNAHFYLIGACHPSRKYLLCICLSVSTH